MSVVELAASEPDPEVVQLLEDLLAKAKAGEIVAVSVAAAHTGAKYSVWWTRRTSPSRLIGITAVLQGSMVDDLVQLARSANG